MEGLVEAISYSHNTVRIGLQPRQLKDGVLQAVQWFDEAHLVMIGTNKEETIIKPIKPGGPTGTEPMRVNPSR